MEWDAQDELTYEDMNRIHSNLLNLLIKSKLYDYAKTPIVTDRTIKSIDFIDDINRLEYNLKLLDTSFEVKSWEPGVKLYHEDVNRWERSLFKVYNKLIDELNIKLYAMSGDMVVSENSILENNISFEYMNKEYINSYRSMILGMDNELM